LNWFRDHLPKGQLILDASALINLLGCGATEIIFSALEQPCLIEEKVFQEIRRHPVPGLSHTDALAVLGAAGFIEQVSMDAEEYQLYIAMIQAPLGERLDAGESASLALAHCRKLPIVLDENKGRLYASARFPEIQMISSLKLMIAAAARLGRDPAFAREVIEEARQRSRMGIPRDEKSFYSDLSAE
jgi:predicted nucleic acid-binding protein